MSDIADKAQERIERELESAIQAARGIPAGESAQYCAECGYEIPSDRQNAAPGTIYCIDCATDIEQRARLAGL